MREIAEVLMNANVPVRIDLREGLGHHYPPDFSETLPQYLSWLRTNGA
jgi:hypothetical protein